MTLLQHDMILNYYCITINCSIFCYPSLTEYLEYFPEKLYFEKKILKFGTVYCAYVKKDSPILILD